MSWLLKSKKSKKVKEFDEKVDEILASLSTTHDDRQPGTSEERKIPEENLIDFSKLLVDLRLIKDENDVEQRKIRNEKAEKELERIKELLVESAAKVEDGLPKDSEDLELERRLDDLKRSREEQLTRIREEREKLEKKSEAEYADLLQKLQSQSKSFHCLGASSQSCSESDSGASKRPESPKMVMEQAVVDSEDTSEDESESASPMDWERLLEIIRSDSEDDYSDDSDDSDSSYESSDSEDEPEEESEASLEEVPLDPTPPTFESFLDAIISSLKESKVSGEAQLNDHLQLNEENFVKDMQSCLQKEEEFLEGFRRISDKKDP